MQKSELLEAFRHLGQRCESVTEIVVAGGAAMILAGYVDRGTADSDAIESNPKRSDSYLELARTYEKAGEHEKAAEVYRHAKERFPEDERVRRESEAFRNKRGRSTKRYDKKESDESKEDLR